MIMHNTVPTIVGAEEETRAMPVTAPEGRINESHLISLISQNQRWYGLPRPAGAKPSTSAARVGTVHSPHRDGVSKLWNALPSWYQLGINPVPTSVRLPPSAPPTLC